MNYTVSITSQGQFTIPAPIRKKLGLNKKSQAVVSVVNNKMHISPVKDFLELGGSLKTKKRATMKEIHEAFENDLGKRSV
jgi:AbrB family looped-hinge helix DNA binding protein